jgi:peptidyl-prolyl cis-trans isomerase C
MRGRWLAGAAGPLLALAFWAGFRVGERRGSEAPEAQVPAAAVPACAPQGGLDERVSAAQELKAALAAEADGLRQSSATPEGRREFLKGLLRFELLAREALRKGYGSDPELSRQAKRSLVARFLERELDEPLSRQPVDEAELRTFYEAHREDYQRPERVRISHRLFEASPGNPAERARARAAALASLADLQQGEGAGAAADLGLVTRAQLEVRAGAAVAEAVFERLVGPAAPSGTAVETPQGFHALRLLGREAALDLKLEDVRDAIRRRILFERKSRAYEVLVRELEARAGASTDSALLDSLVVEVPHAP